MASTATATATAVLTPRALADARPASRAAPHYVRLPPIRRAQPRSTTAVCGRRIARNIVVRTAGEAPSEVVTELPEVVKTVQDAWDKLEDKYAVASLAVAGLIALWVSTGVISAIDRLPLVPGALELVGIGYTGWFTYQNLIFEPDREVLIAKIKSTYTEIIESK